MVAPALALFLAGSSARAEEPSKQAASEEKKASAEEKKASVEERKTSAEERKASAEERKTAAEEKKVTQDQPPVDEPAWEREKPTRRSGIVVGAQVGVGLGMVAGYPLDLQKIGRARYYTQTEVGFSGMGVFWVGVSLKDWLTFGLGFMTDTLLAGDKWGGGPGGVFRIEGFPLWPLGGVWREMGATFDAGTAAITVTPKDNEKNNLIDGGAASYIGGGVFYEGIRLWRISTGPGVYAGYMWSDTVRHGSVTLDWRVTLYSGAVEQDKKKASAR